VIPSLLCDQGSLVSRRTQDYKSLCAAVTICAALVNTQTHTHTHIDQWCIHCGIVDVRNPEKLGWGSDTHNFGPPCDL